MDIFDAPITLPDTVYIACSGPNGKPHYSRIPADACVLATNMAVMIPTWYDTAWTVSQWWSFSINYAFSPHQPAYEKGWWKDAMKLDVIRVFGAGLLARDDIPRDYEFECRPDFNLEPRPYTLIPNICRTGCSIASAPLQYCYHKGVKRVIYCGCDMYGDNYMNGSTNPIKSQSSPLKKDHRWGDTEMLDRMIECCVGMDVVSLSETELNIEVI